MKKVLIVSSNYMDLKISSNNRTNFLPQFLHNKGYQVEVVTSNFNHHRKIHMVDIEERDYKFTVLKENGYKKNVSIKRVLSIRSYTKELKKYLSNKAKVDYVISFVPPHPVAKVAYKYAKRVGAEFIIDVRDLWPEAFNIVVKNKMLYNLLFFPLKVQANKTYKRADKIMAVSDTYKNRAKAVNINAKSKTVYIGTSLSEFDEHFKDNKNFNKKNNEIWITYTGTLGNSYDIKTLIRSYKEVFNKGFDNVKLHILGNGPLYEEFVNYAENIDIDVNFHGRLSYEKMVEFLYWSDVVINPLVKNAPQSIINKHADYAASGLPVISTQTTKEYVDLLDKYNAGFSVEVGNYNELAEKIIFFVKNEKIRIKMGQNHREMAEELFNRDKIYDNVIKLMEEK